MKFIKLFSPMGEAIQPIMNYSDLTFTYGVDELSTIEFKISGYEDVAAMIECEGYLETEDDRFVIKEISEDSDFTKTVYGVQDVEDLKGALVRNFNVSKVTAIQALQAALTAPFAVYGGIDQTRNWRAIAVDNITRKRSISMSFTTVWDIIQKIKEVYHVELVFNTKLQKIDLYNYNSIGKKISEQGNEKLIFYDDINVAEMDIQTDSDDFATIVYGYGRGTSTDTKTFNYKKTSSKNGKTTYYSDDNKKNIVGYKYTTTKDGENVTCFQKYVSGDNNDDYYYARTTTSGETTKQTKITVDSKNKKIKITTTKAFTIGIKDASQAARDEAAQTFPDVDFTKNCVYDYTYSNKKIRKYLFDEAYDDADQILEDCCYWLRELHQPHKSFSAKLIDFSKINGDYRNIGIGDTITVRSRNKNRSIQYRVVSMTVYDDYPEQTEVELSSRKKTLADSQAIQKRFMTENTNSSGSISTLGTGAVSSSAIGIGAINSSNYGFIDASDLIGVIDGNTLDIHNVLADNITAGTIDASQIDVINMNADNITTGTIDASKANIINLNADAINSQQLTSAIIEAGALTADNISSIKIDASQIKSGEIDATNINIKNINGHNIADGTIVAEALAQEVITNLKGNTVYYQAEQPKGDIKEGSLWYKTVEEVNVSFTDGYSFTLPSGLQASKTNGWIVFYSEDCGYQLPERLLQSDLYKNLSNGTKNVTVEINGVEYPVQITKTGDATSGKILANYQSAEPYMYLEVYESQNNSGTTYSNIWKLYLRDGQHPEVVLTSDNKAAADVKVNVYKSKTTNSSGDANTHNIYVYQNGQWVEKTLDASTFTAGSITSREMSSEYIYSGTIYADQIGISSNIDKNHFSGFTLSEDAIYRNNAGLGVAGNGNIYLGVNGFSLSDQLVYNANNNKLTFGDNVQMSWGNITGTNEIATVQYVDQKVAGVSGGQTITLPSYIKNTYIDSTNVISPNITGGTITASSLTSGTITSSTITGGNIDSSTIDSDKIYARGGCYIYDGDETNVTTSNYFRFVNIKKDNTSDIRLRLGLACYTDQQKKYFNTIDFFNVSQERHCEIRSEGLDILRSGTNSSEDLFGYLHCGDAITKKVYISNIGTTSTTSTTSTAFPLVRWSQSSEQLVRQTSSSSSRRIKHDITPEISEPLRADKLYDLDVVQFKYNNDYLDPEDERYNIDCIGLIAEDVQEIYPIAADTDEEGNAVGWNANYLIPAMLKLIQEQKEQINQLTQRVEQLEVKE